MSQRVTKSFAVRAAVVLALAGGTAGATSGCEPMPPAQGATPGGLARWEGHAREVFDDNIDPASVGLTMDGPSPRNDPHLRERAQTADVVARVKVQTVTVDSVGDTQTYHLGIQVGVPTLAEAKVPDRAFELSIKQTSDAFGIAKSFDNRLRGHTFVGFMKRFNSDDGDAVLHWHLAPDTAEVAAAVKEAVALKEIGGK
jgi:hypothetical protein